MQIDWAIEDNEDEKETLCFWCLEIKKCPYIEKQSDGRPAHPLCEDCAKPRIELQKKLMDDKISDEEKEKLLLEDVKKLQKHFIESLRMITDIDKMSIWFDKNLKGKEQKDE